MSLELNEARNVDPFERLLLQLLSDGLVQTEDLARRSCLPDRFIDALLSTFESRDWLDASRCLTDDGRAALRVEVERRTRLAAGHVFQDPSNGVLWSQFSEGNLPHADVRADGDFPRLVRSGGRGEHVEYVRYLRPRPGIASPPAAEDVRRAIRGWSTAQRRGRPRREGAEPDELEAALVSGELDGPVSVYLICAWSQGEGTSGEVLGDWTLWGPNGYPADAWARREVELRARDDAGLRDYLIVPNDTTEETVTEEASRLDEQAEAIRQIHQLTRASVPEGPIKEAMIDFECQVLALRRGGRDPARHLRRNVLREARCVVEEALQTVLYHDAVREARRRLLDVEQTQPEELMNSALERLRPLSAAVPEAIRKARPMAGTDPSERGWRLRESAALCLLVASVDVPTAPRSALEADARLFERIERVAQAGGDASHAGTSPPSFAQVGEVIEDVRKVIELLFPIGERE